MTSRYEVVGLKERDYRSIIEILGREPNDLELSLYGVMWSEHCSYKHSRILFKHFPTSSKRVLQGPGENAGIVDIGDNLGIAMKIESHNHPSAVEPYEGAATGVGGIIRDIFAMGARPIALLNSLRLGDIEENDRTKYLLDGVVKGIGGYGNCIGIPTVGGEIYFNHCYLGNPLVNAMCVGVIKHDEIHRGNASGVGNSVMYIGAATGRDGIGGASFASIELTDESEEKRSAVQVGDPFMEKLLMEACLELLKTGSIIGLQDLGAAGLTSACCETAARGEGGMEIDILKVPRREEGMTSIEVMISESQERMLLIVEKGSEEEVNKIVEKWGLHSVVIGRVTDDGMLRILEGEKIMACVPASSLDSSGSPEYDSPYEIPSYIKEVADFDESTVLEPKSYQEIFLKLLTSPNIGSKEWIYKQYDYMVGTNTVVNPGSDAAVLRIPGTKKGIALTTDCNSRYCYLNPREGSKIAVAEAARNIICSGGRPLAVTDGLNFGNPEKPDRFWQFRESILGISEACRELDTPVISGNVSFYNETEEGAIYPTPIIGMVGLLEDVEKACTIDFKKEEDLILLLGETKNELGGSEYLSYIHGIEIGKIPSIDFSLERKIHSFMLSSIEANLLQSAHDISEGGLIISLAQCCMKNKIGAIINIDSSIRKDVLLFGESQTRFIITVKKNNLSKVKDLAKSQSIPYEILGETGGNHFNIHVNGEKVIDLPIKEIEEGWRGVFKCLME